MDVRTTLKNGIAKLRESDVPSFTLATELLLLHALGRDRTWLYAHPEEQVSSAEAERFFSLIARRANGEPTQHLTGKQEFWGLEFEVTPHVLIPRPETEHVIEVALDRLAARELRAGRKQTLTGEGLQIADIGTGSRRIAMRHSVSDRIHFLECNLLDGLIDRAAANANISDVGAQLYPERERRDAAPLLGKAAPNAESGARVTDHGSRSFDLIASNPPYIGRREAATLMREVRDHEPEIALYGGEEGYELYADLIAQAAAHLKPGGILVLELGHNSLPAVQPLLDPPTWAKVAVTNDLAGIPRVIAAERI